MPAPRIQVLLDYPFPALLGESWDMSKLAGGLKFATRYPAVTTGIGGVAPSGLTPSACPDELWRVPGLGVIALKPRYERTGVVNYTDPASDVWKPEEVDVSNDNDGGTALTLYSKAGTVARTRKSGASALIGLLADVATTVILNQLSTTLRIAWRTKASLAANEGWAVSIQPVRTFDDFKARRYIALGFGNKYQLGIDLNGTAELYENRGTAGAPVWIARKVMDVGGGGVDLTKDFTVSCVPIGGRYLVFRFGVNRFKAGGFRLASYIEQHDFVYDCVKEGEGNYYDAALDQFVVSPPGQLSIALNATGTDYRFLPYKLRYDTTPVTAVFMGEPLTEPIPGQTPTITAYGYAHNGDSDPDPQAKTGAGTLTATFTDAQGNPWNDDATLFCPTVTFTASSNKLYTPELWYLEASIAPLVYTPPYTPYDASEEWIYIRFQRTAKLEPAHCSIKFKSESRYAKMMRRGGPIRIKIDGVVVFDGYIRQRTDTLWQHFVDGEYEGRDMTCRLDIPCGKFVSQDGKSVGALIRKLIRKAGFYPENIVVHSSTLQSAPGDLQGLLVESFDEPQNLKLYNWDCDIFEGIKDLTGKYSIQGYDTIRVRTIGDDWHVYLPWYGGEALDAEHPDPVLTFYTYSGDNALNDAQRWAAGLFKITSGLEFQFNNPQFNALELYTTAGAGDDGFALKATVTPPARVLNDPTSQDFEGLLMPAMISTTTTANTEDELCREARFSYEVKQREENRLSFQAEWQPGIDVDQECTVVGVDLEENAVSYGVYRVDEIDVEIKQDENADVNGIRSFDWSGSYTLQWARPTTDDYPLPMFSEFVPPAKYAGSVRPTGE